MNVRDMDENGDDDVLMTIKYMQQDLEERITKLEERAAANQSIGRINESSSSYLTDIDVRACGNNIVFKIQCENRKGCLVQLISVIENMNLTVVSSTSVSPFGSSALHITIVAQMDKEFNLRVEDVGATLESLL